MHTKLESRTFMLKCNSNLLPLIKGHFYSYMFYNKLIVYLGFFSICSNGEVADEVEMESEKAEDESDEDIDHTAIEEDPKLTELWGEMTPKLSKSQEKELRKIRKTDYSWISAL